MPSNLFTGNVILAESSIKASIKLTRTQTAKAAAKAIRKKYGTIDRNERYYHRGDGDWVKYTTDNYAKQQARPPQPAPQKIKTSIKKRALRKGGAKVGRIVYSKLGDGSYVKRKVKYIEDRGFYRILHTVKVFKNGKIGKGISTSAEGDFYI